MRISESSEPEGGHIISSLGARYYVPSSCVSPTLPSWLESGLATVFVLPKDVAAQDDEARVTDDWIKQSVDKYNCHDDVFNDGMYSNHCFTAKQQNEYGEIGFHHMLLGLPLVGMASAGWLMLTPNSI